MLKPVGEGSYNLTAESELPLRKFNESNALGVLRKRIKKKIGGQTTFWSTPITSFKGGFKKVNPS